MRPVAILLGVAAGVGLGGGAVAQQVTVQGHDCGRRIHVVAHKANASDVLSAAARALGLQVWGRVARDAAISVDRVVTDADLVGLILPDQNVILTHRRVRGCQDRLLLVGIYLLPGTLVAAVPAGVSASTDSRPALPPPSAAKAAVAAAMAVPVTPEAREQDELYQRAHGMLPEVGPARSSAP